MFFSSDDEEKNVQLQDLTEKTGHCVSQPKVWQKEIQLKAGTMEDRKHQIVNRDEARLSLVLKIADLGYWDFDPEAEILDWSARGKSFFGVSANM